MRTKAKAGNKVKVKRSLVQARVKEKTKQKLTKIAEISSRKLASYVALVLEDHAAQVDLRAMKALSVAWRGVKQDRNSVVRAEDGPKK